MKWNEKVEMNIDYPTIALIDTFIEQTLEKYREIDGIVSDIRYKQYGDINKFYSHNLENELPITNYTYLSKDCTYSFLDKIIGNNINVYLHYIKIENCLPEWNFFGCACPPIGFKKRNQRLAIYYDGCNMNGDLIEFRIGIGSCDV